MMKSMSEGRASSQPTQPKGINPATGQPYEPADIPIPTREEFLRNMSKVAPPPRPQPEPEPADNP